MTQISTIGFDQRKILAEIVKLHLNGSIALDPTYSKGVFYADGRVPQPLLKFDAFPQTKETVKARAENLPLPPDCVESIVFDPPFLVGFTKEKPTGIIGQRFWGFRYIKDLWAWYDLCLAEHFRVLKNGGKLVFKCQDTVSSGKQHLSHVHIIKSAENLGFYCKDLFVLLAKSRMTGHNHQNQKHARKYHCYFLVFEKKRR